MRAPSLARMAAVAAPRPDAEPVTIAQKPSLAIAFPLFDFEQPRCGRGAVYHIAQPIARKSNKLHCAELMQSRPTLMSGSQVALRNRRLSRHRLLPIMRRKKRRHTRPGATPGEMPRSKARNAVAESENIVAETAEKIFADLADTQTINRDKKGELESAAVAGAERSRTAAVLGAGGLRRLGRQPGRRFQRAERGRTFRRGGAAGRNHAGGMAAGASQDRLARRRDDGGPGKPEGSHHAQCRRQSFRPRPRRAVCQSRQPYRGARQRRLRPFDRAGRSQAIAGSRPASISAATTTTP